MIIAAVVFMGFIVDCIFGDPVYRFHPVRIMGWFISKGEKILRKITQRNAGLFISGTLLSLLLISTSFTLPFLLLHFLYKLHIAAGIIVEIAFCYQIFAAKALKHESMKVYYELEKNDIAQARLYLSYIVGRDTQNLNEEEISKAAVETVAENLSDGVTAPMMYMFIGGAPLGFAYKAVSTLDSMIAYNNEKYAYFGKFAARLDDVVNFISSRISALIMILSSVICKLNVKQAWRIFKRDRYNHKSPNSAQTESVCAGALGISLSGDNYYKGVLVQKPTIGDALRPAVKNDIRLANKLMYATSWLGLIIGVGIRMLIYFFI
jgi:adenosylcobinamide-phosphate synthase